MLRDFACRRVSTFVSLLPEHNRRADDAQRCKPQLETLEPRNLMTATPGEDWQNLLSHGGVCNCSICTGQGLNEIAAAATVASSTTSGPAASNPLSSIPALSSNSGATAKLFLDFNGHTQASWGSYTNVITPVYDQDGDRTTFSTGELASIQEIWARVAEDYAPFNIDVTTIDPGSSADRVVARIAIGGNYSDWFGQGAGGVAYIGGFYNGAPNVGYVFEDALGNGNARYVAEAASHEAGHLFGLLHQSLWSGNTLVDEYYEGTAAWAPIMGVGYYSQRTTWHNGTDNEGPASFQDDMALLAGTANGFGYRTDDFGSTQALATALSATANSVNIAGRISTNTDQDWFSFTTTGGALNLTLNVAQVGANLDSVLELRNASGTLLVTANPTTTLSASLSSSLTSGTYFVVVRSSGGYGNVGQYTLTGTAPVGSTGGGGGNTSGPVPEINVNVGTTVVQSGGVISFGSLQVGQFVNRVITIKNTGNATLTLIRPTAAQMPAGFTIVTNLVSTSLLAGQSTTLTLRYTPTSIGDVSQLLTLASNDADESAFELHLTGTATPAPIIRAIDNGSVGFTTTGAWTRYVGIGRETDIQTALKGTGTTTATWTFNDMPPGQYRIHASWTGSILYATNAPFTIHDGDTALGTVLVNQERASSGLTWGGTAWSNLGTFSITGNTIRITLNNSANDRVVADAIRIERIGDLPDVSGAAAAGSTLAATRSSAANINNDSFFSLAPLASSFSLNGLSQGGSSSLESVDEVFSATRNSRMELLLLVDALDLLLTAKDATSGNSASTSGNAAADDLAGEDWLLGEQLSSLLR